MAALNRHNLIIALTLASFVYVAIFGLSMGMNMNNQGQMTNCPFMSEGASICPMTIGDHVSAWETILMYLTETIGFVWLGIIMSVVLFILPTLLSPPNFCRFHLARFFDFSETKIFDFLRLAFADGILHSRIYA